MRFFSIFLYQKFGDCHHKSSKFNQIYTREKKMSFLLSRAYPFVISMGTIQSPMLSFLLGGGGGERSVYISTQCGKQLPLMNGHIMVVVLTN